VLDTAGQAKEILWPCVLSISLPLILLKIIFPVTEEKGCSR